MSQRLRDIGRSQERLGFLKLGTTNSFYSLKTKKSDAVRSRSRRVGNKRGLKWSDFEQRRVLM